MSSEWTIVSPSMVSAGPGGGPVDVTIAPNPARGSAGEPPFSAAVSLPCNLVRLNPDPASLTKNAGGLIFAVAVMCASTSRTVQSVDNDDVDHWASSSDRKSDARFLRSAWITGQISISPPQAFPSARIHRAPNRRTIFAPGAHAEGG